MPADSSTQELVFSLFIFFFGLIFFVQGLIGLKRGHIEIIVGRRRGKVIHLTGKLGKIFNRFSVLAGSIGMLSACAALLKIIPFHVSFIATAIAILSFKVAAYCLNFMKDL